MTFLPRLYAIVDTVTLERRGMDPLRFTGALLENGVRLLQYRHKGPFSRRVFAEAEAFAALCHEAGAHCVIDDRGDIARVLGAGLHVGQDDLAPADARRVIGNALLGFSTHNATQLQAGDQEPVDYLAIGPVFATGSKENPDPVLGVDQIRDLRALTTRPLVAIGGITLRNAEALFHAGIDSVAVISDLLPADDDLSARIREWVRATA
ncbi:MAG: thiamine phosphate synthase [Acidobacteria bacterium]|nr:thiamine phosphate synthase [Acidobacteriota bacterium]